MLLHAESSRHSSPQDPPAHEARYPAAALSAEMVQSLGLLQGLAQVLTEVGNV